MVFDGSWLTWLHLQALTFVRGFAALLGPPIAGFALDRLQTVVSCQIFEYQTSVDFKYSNIKEVKRQLQTCKKINNIFILPPGGSLHLVHHLPCQLRPDTHGGLVPCQVS